jgi:hypothetical protein
VFGDWQAHRLIPSETTRQRPGKLSRSEMNRAGFAGGCLV